MERTAVTSKNKKHPPPAASPTSPHTAQNIAILKQPDLSVELTDSEPENTTTTSKRPSTKRLRTTTTPLMPTNTKPTQNRPEISMDTIYD